ncbi:MAG: DUF3575 domain-containing protein [Bacteroidales bacterium]
MGYKLKRKRIELVRQFFLIIIFSCILNSAQAQNIQRMSCEKKIEGIAFKTNLMYDGAMVPNIGVEILFPQQWSLNASWNYAWWNNDSRHRYWRTYGGEIEARKWHGRIAQEHPLRGHHTGLFMMSGMYDFEWGHTGYMNDLYFGIGVSYGYAVKIAHNLSLDFAIGIGYLGGTYYKYIPQDAKYCMLDRRNLSYFGPIKAEMSLVWFISNSRNHKKGGRK